MPSLPLYQIITDTMVLSFEQIPTAIGELLDRLERIENILANQPSPTNAQPKYVDINGAAAITSRTPNALRVQISLGNLKSIKKGSKHYFEREYLEKWIAGDFDKKEGAIQS